MRILVAISLLLIPLHSVGGKDPAKPLRPLSVPLAEVVKAHPGKDVLVVFSADWDLSGNVLRKYLREEPLLKILSRPGLEVYHADCTNPDGAGSIEMQKHGVNATPVSAALQHRDGQITFTRLNLTSIKTLAHDLRTLIGKAKQDGADQPATAPKLELEGNPNPKPEPEVRPR